MEVVTYENEIGTERMNICPACEVRLLAAHDWPRDRRGVELMRVKVGLHSGACGAPGHGVKGGREYMEDLEEAGEILDGRLDADGFPEGEREKAIADALNNTWSEGITIMEWVGAAERVITGRVPA